MKSMRFFIVLAGALFASAMMSGQTVTEFIIAKINDNYQTQDGSTSAGDFDNQGNTNAYGIFAQVTGTGLSGTYSFTTPTTPTPTTINITTVETGSLVYENAFAYADATALNAAFPDGDYSMAIPNTNNSNLAPDSVSLFNLSGGTFSNVPMITGGTWSGGRLLIDPTQNYTLNFIGFSGFGAGDSITLAIDGSGSNGHDVDSSSAVTSFLISAGDIVLANGNTTRAELNFINGIDTDTSITGATGFTGYVTILSFEIQAIPEPSTYAAIFGALALAGVILRRRRRVVA